MCGIAAIFARHAPLAPATVERATGSLHHRGPDGQRGACVLQERFGLAEAS